MTGGLGGVGMGGGGAPDEEYIAISVVPVHAPEAQLWRTYADTGAPVGFATVCTHEQPLHPGIVELVASTWPIDVARYKYVLPVHVAFGSVFGHVDAATLVNAGTVKKQSTKAFPLSEKEVHVEYTVLSGIAGGGGVGGGGGGLGALLVK